MRHEEPPTADKGHMRTCHSSKHEPTAEDKPVRGGKLHKDLNNLPGWRQSLGFEMATRRAQLSHGIQRLRLLVDLQLGKCISMQSSAARTAYKDINVPAAGWATPSPGKHQPGNSRGSGREGGGWSVYRTRLAGNKPSPAPASPPP